MYSASTHRCKGKTKINIILPYANLTSIKNNITFFSECRMRLGCTINMNSGRPTAGHSFGDGTTYMRKRENERVNMFGETLNVYVGASVGSLREDFKPRVIDCWWSADWTQKCHLKQNFENLKC